MQPISFRDAFAALCVPWSVRPATVARLRVRSAPIALLTPLYMKRYWLLFSQAVTVLLAAYFVVATLQPSWLKRGATYSRAGISLLEAPSEPRTEFAPGSLAAAAQKAMPAVVSINTSKEVRHPRSNDPWFQFFFGDVGAQQQAGLGSGVIVSPDGYILTNNHVVEGADQIEVTLSDGRQSKARVIGTDPDTDLAVLKIELEKLPVIVLGNSDHAVVGDTVLAIGNPFGVGQTVTSGIVSALGRNQLGINTFENFIQTDAAINPGNSGGALIDVDGNLLGINTAIYSQSGGSMGIGFAIPVSTAKLVMDGLVKDGRVTRGWIGVEPNELSPELAETFGVKARQGVIITGVLQAGPAAKAGMLPGDVIVQVNDQAMRNVGEMMTAVAALPPGTPANFGIQRGSESLTLSITPGERPTPQRTRQPR
jgi:serine protease DegQ